MGTGESGRRKGSVCGLEVRGRVQGWGLVGHMQPRAPSLGGAVEQGQMNACSLSGEL